MQENTKVESSTKKNQRETVRKEKLKSALKKNLLRRKGKKQEDKQ